MSAKIEMVLEFLGDGRWHGKEELQLQFDLPPEEMIEIFSFLGIYGFAENDESHNRIRITEDFKKILSQTIT